jgi:predicted permease
LRWLNVIGRLASGVSPDQAKEEMKSITAQLVSAYPKENGSTIFVMRSLREKIVGKIQPLLLVLLGAVGFVLLITCANVANLLLTRSIGRRKEFAVRSALGASRGNLIAQLLTESLLLSSLGAAVGLLGANSGLTLLLAALPDSQLQSMPYLRDAAINLPVLVFLCGVTLLTGILFGLAPALDASRSSLNEFLKDESRGGTSTSCTRLRNTLVVAEIAISLVLLVGAGLMLQSLRALLRQNPGFEPRNVLTFDVNLPDSSYPSDKSYPFNSLSALRFDHEFTQRLRNSPGVLDVASTNIVPVSGNGGTIRFLIEGRPKAVGQEDESNLLTVSTGYFSTLKVPLVAGRLFTPNDTLDAREVLVVNRAFARSYFPNDDPLGKRIRFTFNAKEPYREIIGLVGDVTEVDLAAPPPPLIYFPNDQGPNTYISYLVRTAGDPLPFESTARSLLRDLDPQLPLIQPQTLEQIADQSPSVFLRRYPSYLIGSFAALALILAVVGLYGLISYMVLQRTREIGIRVALGAQRPDILRMVLRQGVRSALTGVVAGVLAGLGVTRLMGSLLYGVTPSDAFTFAGAAVLLLVVAFAACSIPARRAVRVDPVVALRYE